MPDFFGLIFKPQLRDAGSQPPKYCLTTFPWGHMHSARAPLKHVSLLELSLMKVTVGLMPNRQNNNRQTGNQEYDAHVG